MKTVARGLGMFLDWMNSLKRVLMEIWGVVLVALGEWTVTTERGNRSRRHGDTEAWRTNEELRTYRHGDRDVACVTVHTSTHAFTVDLQRLSCCSEYFRGLSRSRMRETRENVLHLQHVPSSVFHNLLEFSFHGRFEVPPDELASHIQVCSYLMAESFLSECLSALAAELNPQNCRSYLSLVQDVPELRLTVFSYLSHNLLELPHVVRSLNEEEKEELIRLRTAGDAHLCCLRKENLTSWEDPETERARRVFVLEGSEESGSWRDLTELPFRADKWCFTTALLHNYLYLMGGFRRQLRRGWEFQMASFRYNPLTDTWASTAALLKRRRHFSAVACAGGVYAVGGWYLDSLVTPDSSTALYTAVERYDPWDDSWRLVSSLPLTDFQFTVSLSHDVPLATSSGHFFYVLGNIQRTGEKLLLQYDTTQDSWTEILPTLTRADADLPTLYFLGAAERLFVIGGNNSQNVVTSFCLRSRKWEQVRGAEKVAFAGQGALSGHCVLLPSVEHNTVVKLDLQTSALLTLPPLPVSSHYESAFHLCF